MIHDPRRVAQVLGETLDAIAEKVFDHDGPYDGDELLLRIEELVDGRRLASGSLVRATNHRGETFDGVVVERILADSGWRVCGSRGGKSYDVVSHDEAPPLWVLELRAAGAT